jgi:hypothetical protein
VRNVEHEESRRARKEDRIMKKTHRFSLFVFVLAAIWMLTVLADAQAQGKRQEKDKNEKHKKKNEQMIETIKYKPRGMTDRDLMEWTNGNPPGWSRGEKAGWGGAGAPPGQMEQHGEQEIIYFYPRGSENWDTSRKADWQSQFQQSRTRILERLRARAGMSREDEESAMFSFEGAAREGVPLIHVESTMDRAITRGMRGPDIEKVTRAMSYGADKDTDYSRLDQFIEKRMNESETGDDLALSIYKEIDGQHAAKPAEPAKKPWWKRLIGS